MRSFAPAFALSLALALALAAHAAPCVAAAPKQQQCIAAAESGQQLRSRSKLIEARKAFAACTASTCPAVIRRDCGRWIEELEATTPTVTVKLEDASGAEVADGRVLLDGDPMPRAADGRATQIDPGVRRFVWMRDEEGNVEQQVVVREGEHNRVIVLRPPMLKTEGPEAARTTERAPDSRARGPLPWVVGGAGIALAATGGIFWGIGLNDRSTLSATCASSHTCAQSDVDASHTKLIVGDVLLGVGVVALAASVYLFLRQGDSPAQTTGSR